MKPSALRSAVLGVLAAATLGAAHAGTVNFIDLIEGTGGYGEGAWSPLTLQVGGATLTITGRAGNDDDPAQYAYLDWGNAGLGVCKDVIAGATVNNKSPRSGTNECNPGSDDNVTVNEWLSFVFDRDVVISRLWFNNNHDGGFVAGDKVAIDGNAYNAATGYANGANGIGPFTVRAGYDFRVAYFNQEFYVSGLEATALPEPGSLALAGLALAGLAALHRRRA